MAIVKRDTIKINMIPRYQNGLERNKASIIRIDKKIYI